MTLHSLLTLNIQLNVKISLTFSPLVIDAICFMTIDIYLLILHLLQDYPLFCKSYLHDHKYKYKYNMLVTVLICHLTQMFFSFFDF